MSDKTCPQCGEERPQGGVCLKPTCPSGHELWRMEERKKMARAIAEDYAKHPEHGAAWPSKQVIEQLALNRLENGAD